MTMGLIADTADFDLPEPPEPLLDELSVASELFAAWSADLEQPVSARARVRAPRERYEKRRIKIHLQGKLTADGL